MRPILKRSIIKRRLLAESEEDQFDYQALLQKSRSNPVYVYLGTGTGEDKENGDAIRAAVAEHGGPSHIVWLTFDNYFKGGEHTPNIQKQYDLLCKLQGSSHGIYKPGWIFVLYQGRVRFEFLSRSPGETLGPWKGIAPDNHIKAREEYSAQDLFQYLRVSIVHDGIDTNLAAGLNKNNAMVVKWRGMVLRAMAISPQGKDLTYDELLMMEPRLKLNSPTSSYMESSMIQEHLKRANLARKQGNYLEESIYRKLANNLLAERSDSDIYGIDPDEKVILSKWFSARISKGVNSTKFLQWFVEFMKNPDFVKQWDKEYGQTTQPLAKFLTEAKAYFEITS